MTAIDLEKFIQKYGGMTEEYTFYKGEVVLRYDPVKHLYFLVTDKGLIKQDGVTNIAHIIDKSSILMPWACKMMVKKLTDSLQPHLLASEYYYAHKDILEKLITESKTAHREKLEDAGNVGHEAHAWIEDYIKNCLKGEDWGKPWLHTVKDQRAKNAITQSLIWMNSHNVRWLSTERKIYSRDYGFAGTMDGLARVDSCSDPKCCPVTFKDRLSIVDWKTSNYLYIEYLLQTSAYKEAYEEETGQVVEDIWIIRLGKEEAEVETWHIDSVLADVAFQAFYQALQLSRAMEQLETAFDDVKERKTQVKKEEKEKAKQDSLLVKCKGADKYKGIRYPKCNKGAPCQTCLEKYNQKHPKKT